MPKKVMSKKQKLSERASLNILGGVCIYLSWFMGNGLQKVGNCCPKLFWRRIRADLEPLIYKNHTLIVQWCKTKWRFQKICFI